MIEMIFLDDNDINNICILQYMSIFSIYNKNILPLCGTIVGMYKGYYYAAEKKALRWGRYAASINVNLSYIGCFGLFGLGIGYCISKVLE